MLGVLCWGLFSEATQLNSQIAVLASHRQLPLMSDTIITCTDIQGAESRLRSAARHRERERERERETRARTHAHTHTQGSRGDMRKSVFLLSVTITLPLHTPPSRETRLSRALTYKKQTVDLVLLLATGREREKDTRTRKHTLTHTHTSEG